MQMARRLIVIAASLALLCTSASATLTQAVVGNCTACNCPTQNDKSCGVAQQSIFPGFTYSVADRVMCFVNGIGELSCYGDTSST